MVYGYAGYRLMIDLTTRDIKKEPLEQRLVRNYIGGAGFAIKILYENVRPKIDPFDPENMVVLATGPAQGTLAPGSGRGLFVSKSPLTNSSFRSNFGGFLAHELKHAGYDLIAIKGKADKPVYLVIDDDKVELKDATHLWGKTTYETQRMMKEELGDEKFQTACIGPAGENLVRIASIIHGIHAAGRGGIAAVLGSKRFKGIAIRGSKDVNVADLDGLIEYFKEINKRCKEHPVTGKNLPIYGTTWVLSMVNKVGGLGTRNWQMETFEGWEKITGETTIPKHKIQDASCASCTIGCVKVQEIKEGKYAGSVAKGPEYETLYGLGSVVGVDDFGAIVTASRACDELGLDTISAGVVVAFAMECYERGMLTNDDTEGLKLNFGNGDTLIECIRRIAYRKGFLGDTLAEGVRVASEIIGHGSQYLAMHIKGLEIAGHSPRAIKAVGLGYAVANRGGSHHDARGHSWDYRKSVEERAFTMQNKPNIVHTTQNMAVIGDSLIVCRMFEGIYGLSLTEDHCKIIKLTTGIDMTLPELTRIAERIYTLERCFAVREGLNRKHDTLPFRILYEPIPNGASKGACTKPAELRAMLDEYYKLRGWDVKTGIPMKEKLKELSLEYVAHKLWGEKVK